MCDYEISYHSLEVWERINYKCPRRSLKNADEDGKKYCIFHSKKEEKKGFYKKFKKLYLDWEHNFAGFVFPRDFSFERLKEETGELNFLDAVFVKALFLCTTNFSGAEFSGDGRTNFREAKFSCEGGTDFRWAEFSDKDGTNFGLARFSGEGVTDFSNTRFSGKGWTDFKNVRFSSKGGTNFSFARFSGDGKVNFVGGLFSDETETDFCNVSFEKPENITFDRVNLAKCQFIGTDLEHVNIEEVFWKNKKEDSWWRPWRIKVYDDTLQTGIFKWKGAKNHYKVYQLYNQLLLNYERTYRHHEAGDFYAGQMDMRRRGNLDRKWFSWIILSLYKGIAEYGERPVRVFMSLILVLLAFGLFYIGIGIEGTKVADIVRNHFSPMAIFTGGFWSDYLQGIAVSLDIMTLGKIKFFGTSYSIMNSDNALPRFLKLAQVVLGTSLLTLFLLSVRRRFRKP